jgi:hypothetical protein
MSNAILWYYAPPGSGKTILSSAVVDHLLSREQKTAYFFYSFSDPVRKKPLSAIRALALQIITILTTGLPSDVVREHKVDRDANIKRLQSPRRAASVLCGLLNQCDRVFLVIDGLDECEDDEAMRDILFPILSSSGYGMTKWLLTSRDDGLIPRMMKDLNAIPITPDVSVINEDIHHFLSDRLPAMKPSDYQLDDWVGRSDGSFLYSKFVVDTLNGKGVVSKGDMERKLKCFPSGHTEYYARVLMKMCGRGASERNLVR